MYQTTKPRANLCYEDKISLNATSLEKLKWSCNNLNLNKGRSIKIQNTKIIIQSDVAKSGGWGSTLPGTDISRSVEEGEAQLHINVLGMKAAKLAIESFCRVKIGGTKIAELNKISKDILEYLIVNEITLTAEYLPSPQNIQED